MSKFVKVIIFLSLLLNVCYADEIEMMFRQNVPAKMYFTYVPRGLIVSIEDKEFFNANSVKISQNGVRILDKIGNILSSLNNAVVVEGHSDGEDFANTEFSESWEVSLARANNITKYLMMCDGVNPEKIFSIGYGEIMPLPEKITVTNRIDFVVLNYKATR